MSYKVTGYYEEQRRMEAIADAVADKFGIEVKIVEDSVAPAFYDGKRMVLARRPLMAILEGIEDKNIKALVYHEAGHAFCSDMGINTKASEFMDKFKKEGFIPTIEEQEKRGIWEILQSLEDVRTENITSGMYEGVKGELERFMSKVVPKIPKKNVFKNLVNGLYLKKRYPELYKDFLNEKEKKIVDDIKELDEVDTAKSTEDILDLAGKIYGVLRKYVEKSPTKESMEKEGEEKEKEGEGEGGSDSDSDSDMEDTGDEDEKKGKGSKKPKKEKKKDKKEKEREERKETEHTESLIKDIKEESERYKEKLKELMDSVTRELPTVPIDCSYDFSCKDIYSIASGAKKGDRIEYHKGEDYKSYLATKKASEGYLGVMIRRLKDIFFLKNKLRFEDGHTSGSKISGKNLWKVMISKGDVFQKRTKEDKKDYAISLLIDMSGSMGGGRINEAKKSIILFSEVLSSLNIPFEVLGFSSYGSVGTTISKHERSLFFMEPEKRIGKGGDEEIRFDYLRHWIFKAFNDDYDRRVKARMGAIRAYAQNWDGEAVVWAYERLREHVNNTKVLIVMSDGQPAGSSSNDGNMLFTQRIAEKVGKRVNLIGIGYQYPGVKKIYKNNVVVKTVKELPLTFVQILRRVLKC